MKYGIVHYNTPELITCLISSIRKFDNKAEIFIFENSDKLKFNNLFENIKIIDNSKQEIINFDDLIKESKKYLSADSWNFHVNKSKNNFGSMKHAASVEYLINYIKDNFILLDSDVLLKKSPLELKTEKICSAGLSYYNNKPTRILPYICYLNYNELMKNKIHFFDITKMDSCKESKDTGGSFYSDIISKNLSFNLIKWEDYCVHFGNGSWRTSDKANLNGTSKGTYKEFLMQYKDLWN